MIYDGKPIETMRLIETLEALADISKQLAGRTGDNNYLRARRAAEIMVWGEREGFDEDTILRMVAEDDEGR